MRTSQFFPSLRLWAAPRRETNFMQRDGKDGLWTGCFPSSAVTAPLRSSPCSWEMAGGPGDPHLLFKQHLLQVCCLLLPRYHTVVRSHGQVARLSLRHRLPGAIEAQKLKVLHLQILSPGLRVLTWGDKERQHQPWGCPTRYSSFLGPLASPEMHTCGSQ